jgi:hypothetical protein
MNSNRTKYRTSFGALDAKARELRGRVGRRAGWSYGPKNRNAGAGLHSSWHCLFNLRHHQFQFEPEGGESWIGS